MRSAVSPFVDSPSRQLEPASKRGTEYGEVNEVGPEPALVFISPVLRNTMAGNIEALPGLDKQGRDNRG